MPTVASRLWVLGACVVAAGCGSYRAAARNEDIAAEVMETPGRRFLVVTSTDELDQGIAFPICGSAYIEKDGKRWRLNGSYIDPNIMDKRALLDLGCVAVLSKGVSVQLDIAPQLSGELVIDPTGSFTPESRRRMKKERVSLWTGSLRVGRVP